MVEKKKEAVETPRKKKKKQQEPSSPLLEGEVGIPHQQQLETSCSHEFLRILCYSANKHQPLPWKPV